MNGATDENDPLPGIINIKTKITKVGNSYFIKATPIVNLLGLKSGDDIMISVQKLPKEVGKGSE